MIVGASCTAELIQDDPGGLDARRWACRFRSSRSTCPPIRRRRTGARRRPSTRWSGRWPRRRRRAARAAGGRGRCCNILGPTALGFPPPRRPVGDPAGCSTALGVEVNVAAPLGATPMIWRACPRPTSTSSSIRKSPRPPPRGWSATHGQPAVRTFPIGVGATRDFISTTSPASPASIPWSALARGRRRACRGGRGSVDSNYLTGKRVFIFGDATHAIAAARVASEELGFEVVGLGCLQPRIRPRSARGGRDPYGLDRADHRRLSGGRARHRRASARTGPGHPDGAAYRQAPAHRLRGDLGAGACPGLSGPLFARRWVSRAPTSSSTPGSTRW